MQFSPGAGAVTFMFDDGYVTFMFDDGYKSAKATAKPILDKYGFVGSAAAISSTVGDTRSMTPDDLRNLQAAGWDIASHSVTHPWMSGLSTAAAETELQKSKSTLTALGLTIDSFVWPYGDYNQSLIGGKDLTLTGRTDMWIATIPLIEARPLWDGYGNDMIRRMFDVVHVHNGYLQLTIAVVQYLLG